MPFATRAHLRPTWMGYQCWQHPSLIVERTKMCQSSPDAAPSPACQFDPVNGLGSAQWQLSASKSTVTTLVAYRGAQLGSIIH